MNVDKLIAVLPMIKSKNWWLGTMLVLALALISDQLSYIPALKYLGLSTLSIAIILGIIIGNTVFTKIASHTNIGVDYSKNILLRLGIILYGFRVTFQQIADIGIPAIIIAILIVICTFFLTLQIGTKLLKMDKDTTILIGAGSSICGAAAVMATEPIIRAPAHKVSIAVATVVVFGTLSMFLYPLLFSVSGLSEQAYGVFTGGSIHEVAQVVVAGKSVSEAAAATAVIEKMIRVMMLAPFLVVLSFFVARNKKHAAKHQQTGHWLKNIVIPWFAVLFIVVSGINSLDILSGPTVQTITQIDTIILAMAMAALGLRTHISAIAEAGIKPLLLGFIMWLFLMFGGYLMTVLLFVK